MSFGLWRQVSTSVDGDAAEFGANDISLINKLLNGTVSAIPAVKIASSNGWYFVDNVLKFLNTAQDKQITIRSADVSNNYDLNLPLLTANDEIAALNLAQTIKNKIIDNTNTITGAAFTTPTLNGVKFGDVAITNTDSPYTPPLTKTVIRANATGGAITINLPTAVGNAGFEYHIFRTDNILSTNIITIDGNGTQTIDSNLTYRLYPGEWVKLYSDGANWQVIARPSPSQHNYYIQRGTTLNRTYVAGHLGNASALLISTTSPAANTLWAIPLIVPRTTKFDLIRFQITTASTAGNSRAGIYTDNGNNYPAECIFDTGAISTTSIGVKDTTITSSLQVLQPGIYWLAYEQDTATGQMVILPAVSNLIALNGQFTTATPGWMYAISHTFGALPNPFTAGQVLSNTVSGVSLPVPAIGLRTL